MKKNIIWCGIFAIIMAKMLLAGPAPLSLDDCIDQSMMQNSNIKIALEDKSIADAKTTQAWSAVFPKLSLQYGVNRMSTEMQRQQFGDLFGGSGSSSGNSLEFPSYFDSYHLRVSAQQLLFGTHVFATLRVAGVGKEMANWNLIASKQQILYQTKERYFNILRSHALVEMAKRNYDLIEAQIKKTEALYKEKLVSKADVLRQILQQKNIEQLALTYQSQLKLAYANLNLTLGNPADLPLKLIVFQPKYQMLTNDLSKKTLSKVAIKNRPELKAIGCQIRLYQAQADIEKSAAHPNVFLSGYYGMIGQESTMNYPDNKDYMINLAAEWKFFDSFETASKVSVAKSEITKIQTQYNIYKDTIIYQTQAAIDSLIVAESKIKVGMSELDVAKEMLDISTAQYDAGIVNNLQLLDSQNAYLKAETHYINALFEFEIAKANLQMVLGVDESTLESVLFVDQDHKS